MALLGELVKEKCSKIYFSPRSNTPLRSVYLALRGAGGDPLHAPVVEVSLASLFPFCCPFRNLGHFSATI